MSTVRRSSAPTPRLDGQTGPAPEPLGAPAPKAARDGFERVPIAPGQPEPVSGPLALHGEDAQRAIAASLRGMPKSAGLRAADVTRDPAGKLHVRFDRTLDGLPVFGEQLISHVGADGRLLDFTGDAAPSRFAPDARTPAKITAGDALRTATAAFVHEAGANPAGIDAPPALGYFQAADGRYHQAFQIDLRTEGVQPPQGITTFVDAHSGEVIASWREMAGRSARPRGAEAEDDQRRYMFGYDARPTDEHPTEGGTPAQGLGLSLYSGVVPLQTTRLSSGRYALFDQTRGGSRTMDAQDRTHTRTAIDLTDQNNLWGEVVDNPREQVAIDVHYAVQTTWDFYKDVLGRESFDGRGSPILSYVHVRDRDPVTGQTIPMNDAYWDGKVLNFGDGDGKTWSPLVAIDTVGHEISHGVTSTTSRLQYMGQAGGLNEAMSDIFGTGVRWYANRKNPNVPFSWHVSDQIYTPGTRGDAKRYFEDPKRDGYSIDHLSEIGRYDPREDGGGIHGSSGIANNAFYLMVEGGTNRTSGLSVARGIGMEKALKIMYQAQVCYFRPRTDFATAGKDVLRAAIDLYGEGSPEAIATQQAWTAVGALTPPQ